MSVKKMTSFGLVLVLVVALVSSENKIKARIKSLKCEHDKSIYNGTMFCHLRPTRNGDGNTTAYYIFGKPAYDFWYHIKLYYKFGTIYRHFMVDMDVDVCMFFKDPYKLPKLIQYLMKTLNDEIPNFVHPCPYFGKEGFENINVDRILGKAIPQVSKVW